MKKILVVFGTRPEAVDAGTVILAGTETDDMAGAAEKLLDDKAFYDKMAHAVNPYGDGLAARRIAEIVATGKMTNSFV